MTRVIAHRGASGYLPEHTLAAKVLAYGMGADFIEQDVIATADGELVVLHDTYLDDVSDVAQKYPDRASDDGHFYVIDFTLAELADLNLVERRQSGSDDLRFPNRFPFDLPAFKISKFEDELRLIAGLNASSGRHVGIYPEIKDPGWHLAHEFDLTEKLNAALVANRELISGPIFVQSFESRVLERLKTEMAAEWPLVQLLERRDAERLAGDQAAMGKIAAYAEGVGLPFETLIEPRRVNGRAAATRLANELIEAGLKLHPYTLRRDVRPEGDIDYFETLDFLIHDLKVDAIFCDHPDDALNIRARRSA